MLIEPFIDITFHLFEQMPQPRRPRRDPNSAELAEQRYGAAAYDLHRLREVITLPEP